MTDALIRRGRPAMTAEFDTAAYVAAYLAGNKAAAAGAAADHPDFKSAYQIADELGFARQSLEWEAAVDGAAACYLQNIKF